MLSQRNNDYLSRAYELSRLRHFDLALQEVQRALEHDPLSAEAHVCGAWVWRDRGRLPEAEQSARAALALQPNSAAAHHILAVVLWEQNRIPEAEAAFRDALRFNHPDQPVYLVNFGRMMNANQRSQEALELADQALALAPGMSGAHDVRGLALARLGRAEEARAEYLEALRINPRNAVAHNNLGVLDLGERQAQAATDSFREALRLNPNDERARRNLVLALKARYRLYGWALAVGRFMAPPGRASRWRLLVVALVVLMFALPLAAVIVPAADRVLSVAWMLLFSLAGLAVLVRLVWKALGDPIFNLLLLRDPLGRQAHDFDPIDAAVTLQAACALLGGMLAVASFVVTWPDGPHMLLWGLGGFLALFCSLMVGGTAWFRSTRSPRIDWPAYRFILTLYYGILAAGLTDQAYPALLHLPWAVAVLAIVGLLLYEQRRRRG